MKVWGFCDPEYWAVLSLDSVHLLERLGNEMARFQNDDPSLHNLGRLFYTFSSNYHYQMNVQTNQNDHIQTSDKWGKIMILC